MRNLQVIRHFQLRIKNGQGRLAARLFCIDNDEIVDQRVYFFCDGNHMFVTQFGQNEARLCCDFGSEGLISSASGPDNSPENDFNIIGVQYLFGYSTICVASKLGEIFIYNTATEQVECVGIIDNGIKTMSWSPDQDLVIFISGSDNLLLMTRDFELLLESPVHSEDTGESKPVNIGWGNKETQFHGSEGKEAAKRTTNEIKGVFDWDDRRARVSWRGDGTAFATSTVTPYLSYRQLRVWSREGVLQSTSEYVPGLEQCMCYQPSGSVIATSCRTNDGRKHEISFFEPNCLQHGSFVLPSNAHQSVQVIEVLWNTDSSLLAVWTEDLPNGNANAKKKSSLQIYSANNYHWYLKQSLSCASSADDDDDVTVSWVQWDTENAFMLHVLLSNGTFSRYTFSWTTDCSLGKDHSDSSIVYVVDGDTVLVTPFRHVVVPPPMSAYAFQLNEPINRIVVGPQSNSNDFIAITASNKLHLFTLDAETAVIENSAAKLVNKNSTLEKYHQLIGIAEIIWPDTLDASNTFKLPYHWIWLNETNMMFVSINQRNAYDLCIASIEKSADPFKCAVIVRKTISLSNEVCKLCPVSNESEILMQFCDGEVTRCSYEDMNPISANNILTSIRFPQPLSSLENITVDGSNHVIFLSSSFELFMDSIKLSDKCTSFAFNGDFIVFTTYDHLLYCLLVKIFQKVFKGSVDAKTLVSSTNARSVERGSRIVTVVSKDTKVVLQMPRGNLEVIHPRPLVLHSIKENLDRIQFKASLLIMRRHRIDMNLLYDHNPNMFTENVDKFVAQVDDVVLINLFLSSLRNEDVTKTVYKSEYESEDDGNAASSNGVKVNLICDLVRLQMEKSSEDKFFLAIVTAHVAKTIPEVDLALMKIKRLIDVGVQSQQSATTPEAALRHLCCLVDADKLYNVALGTYDFDLVLMVAEKSQKDPKEYLPYLNELKRMDSNYRKYSIDMHLNRFAKALQHISKCDDRFEECIMLIKKHNLYTQGLKCFQAGTASWKAILHAHASYFMARQQYDEAGIAFLAGDFLQEALQSFKRSGNWHRAICVAHLMDMPPTEVLQLAQYLAEQMKSNGRFLEASEILERYVKDYDGAILALLEAHLWDSAFLMIHRHNKLDLIDNNLRPALTMQSSSVTSNLDQEMDRFNSEKARLLVVRAELEKRSNQLNDDYFLPDSDMYSETSSMTGASGQSCVTGSESRFTSQTSRRRKKLERKKVTLKKGSPFEDVALMESLTETIMRVDAMKEECRELIQALMIHGFQKEAFLVQNKLEFAINEIISSKSDIWPPNNDFEEPSDSLKFSPMATANTAIEWATTKTVIKRRNIPEEYIRFMRPPTLKSGIKWKLESLKDIN